MKNVFFTLTLVCLVAALSAQTVVQSGVLPRKQAFTLPSVTAEQMAGRNRALNEVYVDYFNNEFVVADQNNEDAFYLPWEVNKAYEVSCPNDTIDDLTLKFAGVRFYDIFDLDNGSQYDESTLNSLRVDTLILWIAEHQNNSGLEDTIVLSIYEVDQAAINTVNRGLILDPNVEAQINNTLVWRDTTFTTTGITNQLGGFLFPVDSFDAQGNFVQNGVHIANPERGFIAILEYLGPKQDTFRIADANTFPCTQQDLVSTSAVPRNSLSYINFVQNFGGCQDLSGMGDLSIGTLPANCQTFYRQNMGIGAIITVDAPLSVEIVADSISGCPGNNFNLVANVAGGEPSPSVQWTTNNPNAALGNPFSGATTVENPEINGSYKVYVTVDDGVDVVTDSITLTVNGVFVDLGNDTTIACGSTLTIGAQVSGSVAGTSFDWNTAATTQTITVTPGRTYSVTVENAAGCTDSDDKEVTQPVSQELSFETWQVITYGNGAPNDTVQAQELCVDFETIFRNTSTNTTGWSWLWSFGDGQNTQKTNESPSFTYTSQGVVTVTLEADSGNCNVISDPVSITVLPAAASACITGIEDNDLSRLVSIYPNPTTGALNINFTDISSNDVTVEVFNIVGSKVFSTATAIEGSAIEQVDLSTFNNGIYLVRVSVEGDTFTRTVSVQK